MESKMFIVTNKFALSDGSFILAAADIANNDIDSHNAWDLVIDNEFSTTIKIIDELQLKNRSKYKTEKALVVSGDFDKVQWSSINHACIRPAVQNE